MEGAVHEETIRSGARSSLTIVIVAVTGDPRKYPGFGRTVMITVSLLSYWASSIDDTATFAVDAPVWNVTCPDKDW
jgi:hypothetical protein